VCVAGAKGPVGVAEFLRTSCPPNGVVVDLTMGAGSGAIAAVMEGRRYFGFDMCWESIQVRSDVCGKGLYRIRECVGSIRYTMKETEQATGLGHVTCIRGQ
jgi:predicted RNA methylase